MTRSTYTLHRILAGLLFVSLSFAMANYYFDLGFFGEQAKGVMILGVGLAVIYRSFFAPTRADMREHSERRKSRKTVSARAIIG
jgi:hypothetical protein